MIIDTLHILIPAGVSLFWFYLAYTSAKKNRNESERDKYLENIEKIIVENEKLRKEKIHEK